MPEHDDSLIDTWLHYRFSYLPVAINMTLGFTFIFIVIQYFEPTWLYEPLFSTPLETLTRSTFMMLCLACGTICYAMHQTGLWFTSSVYILIKRINRRLSNMTDVYELFEEQTDYFNDYVFTHCSNCGRKLRAYNSRCRACKTPHSVDDAYEDYVMSKSFIKRTKHMIVENIANTSDIYRSALKGLSTLALLAIPIMFTASSLRNVSADSALDILSDVMPFIIMISVGISLAKHLVGDDL